MITPKHLCREFDVEPAQLRALLRSKYGRVKGRWAWDDKSAPGVRRWLAKIVKPRDSPKKSPENGSKT